MDRKTVATQSMAAALRVRTSVGLGLEEAICVYQLAEQLGIEVRFVDIPSMEGMYYQAPEPAIILSLVEAFGAACIHLCPRTWDTTAMETEQE